MEDLAEAIRSVLTDDEQMTVRQVFYQLVSRGAIEKSELQYRAVVRQLTLMRRDGRADLDSIADNTRWVHKPTSYRNLKEAVDRLARGYRRAKWDDQELYVEVWLEKDALAGVLFPVTGSYDVPLMVTRGYPSVTYLASAAGEIQRVGKPTVLLYCGDYDPSGVDINRNVQDGIHEFAPEADVTLQRIAVTEDQIASLGLPTRPTKRSDARAHKFEGESVELDAIPGRRLRELVEGAIKRYIDMDAWILSSRRELGDRGRLRKWIEALPDA